jgi:hypothetical protein
MRPRLRQIFAACLLFAAALTAHADPSGYASGFDTLYRIDLSTAHATAIGKFGAAGQTQIVNVDGLALAPDGQLFGVADNLRQLLRIDTTTGRASLVGSLDIAVSGAGQFNSLDFGLAFTCDGRLWLSSDVRGLLWEVNPATGQARQVGALGAQVSGLAGKDHSLYGVGANGDEALNRIDTNTGQATQVGRLAPNLSFVDAGLDFDASGKMWLTIDYLVAPEGQPQILRNDLAYVDINTGRATIVGPITGAGSGIDTVQMEGLAVAPPAACSVGGGGPGVLTPVPTLSLPGRGVLLALVMIAAGFALRRRSIA